MSTGLIIALIIIGIGVAGAVFVFVKKFRVVRKNEDFKEVIYEKKEVVSVDKLEKEGKGEKWGINWQRQRKIWGARVLMVSGMLKVIGKNIIEQVKKLVQAGGKMYQDKKPTNFWVSQKRKEEKKTIAFGGEAGAIVLQAQKLFGRKLYKEAEEKYVQAVSEHHKNVAAFMGLGELYMVQRNYTDAAESFRQAIKLSKNPDEKAFVGLAQALKKSGDKEGAKKALQEGLSVYSDSFRMKVEMNDLMGEGE